MFENYLEGVDEAARMITDTALRLLENPPLPAQEQDPAAGHTYSLPTAAELQAFQANGLTLVPSPKRVGEIYATAFNPAMGDFAKRMARERKQALYAPVTRPTYRARGLIDRRFIRQSVGAH